MKKLTGVVIPIVTPFKEDGTVDAESLKRLADYCIDGGMDCLYPCGTTGEMMYLTLDERKFIADTVVKHVNGKVPVYIHVGAWSQADTISLAQHAVEIGADGIGVVTPAFYKLSDQGLIDFYLAVAQSVPSDFPVYMYAIPQNAVNDLNKNVCEEVSRACPNVIGVKYSFADMTRMQALMTVKEGQFEVLAGPDHLFAAFCSMGGKGTVSGNAMCAREHYKELWKAIQAQDYALAAKLQRRTNKINAVMCATKNIASYKVILKNEGIISCASMRPPMEQLTNAEEAVLLKRLSELEYKKVMI